MKKITLILFTILFALIGIAQTGTITYQAIVYGASSQQLPGANKSQFVLSNKTVCMKFSFIDFRGLVEYEETHITTTNSLGMVNLLVGTGTQVGGYAADFDGIVWDTTGKTLRVDLDQLGNCTNYTFVSSENLTSVPFALYSLTEGTPGNGISATIDNGDGTYTFTFTDGTSFTTDTLIGDTGAIGPQGPQGIQGSQGSQGPIGPTGAIGPIGLVGFQGAVGRIGIGSVGPQGVQGPKGDTGVMGPQGIPGIQGPKGDTGVMGPQGIQGVQGPKGDTGVMGPQGIQGIQGPKGDTGEMGPQGIQGIQGPKGDTGVMGPQGIQGIQGPKGDTGAMGPQGLQGIQGPKGDTGVMGPQGLQGIQGPKGDTGVVGPQGLQGIQGPKGDTGVMGPQGIQGVQGPKGDTGVMGPRGIQGTQGIQQGPKGDTGVMGPQGLQGIQGPKGDTGAMGPQGIQGIQGPKGDTGVMGPQGPQGIQGPKGDTGVIGPQGIQGIQGPKGDTGVVGPQGLQGIQGIQGPKGDTGVMGPQGIQGVQGPKGDTGLFNPGTSSGNMAYWSGLEWNVNGNNIFNDGSSIGIGTSSPDSSAILDISSTTKGFLPPSMTTAQRDSISSPKNGLAIYNLDKNCLEFWKDTIWYDVCGNIEPVVNPWPSSYVHCGGTPTDVVDVTSPATGKVWMDRNLGASQVATSLTDANSLGDLYQWGREADGHQCRNSTTRYATLASGNQAGHGDWVYYNTHYQQWQQISPTSTNNTLWQGVNGINNPCPTGYRVPTQSEFMAEVNGWSSTSDTEIDAYNSFLKLTRTKSRLYSGSFSNSSEGNYHVSDKSGNWLRIKWNGVTLMTNNGQYWRGNGSAVRCIKD